MCCVTQFGLDLTGTRDACAPAFLVAGSLSMCRHLMWLVVLTACLFTFITSLVCFLTSCFLPVEYFKFLIYFVYSFYQRTSLSVNMVWKYLLQMISLYLLLIIPFIMNMLLFWQNTVGLFYLCFLGSSLNISTCYCYYFFLVV